MQYPFTGSSVLRPHPDVLDKLIIADNEPGLYAIMYGVIAELLELG